MRAWALAALPLLLAGCATRAAMTPEIVGTWRLIECWDRESEGQPKQYPFGEHPLGLLVYDRAGNMLVEFAKNPPPPRLTPDELGRLSADELGAMIADFVAYFGTYTVENGVVIHHVLADMRRDYTGTDQRRPFRIIGDELLIGDSVTWLRRFVRVK